ncbi:hypothetical protein ACET3Z_009622 [Daucus carota]
MPGIPLSNDPLHPRGVDQMYHDGSHVHLSEEDQIAAEQSFSIYCKPVELYNILQRRAVDRPFILQRCLRYKQQVKTNKKIQMTVYLSGTVDDRMKTQIPFPMHILLARPMSSNAENSAVYQFSKVCVLTSYTGMNEVNQSRVKFILPEMNKLSVEIDSGKICILFISCAESSSLESQDNFTETAVYTGGSGLVGKITLEMLHLSWEKSPSLALGERVELFTTVDMKSCIVKPSFVDKKLCISFQNFSSSGDASTPLQLPVYISVKEVGAREKTPNGLRLRSGNVIFSYRYYNNKLHKIEVTEDFSCPFCLVKCASFKGLRHHLPSSHDLFSFEFWVDEEYQIVFISFDTDKWISEINGDGLDPKRNTFIFCYKPLRRREPKSLHQYAKHVHPFFLDSDSPAALHGSREENDGVVDCMEYNTSSANATGCSSACASAHLYPDPECIQSVSISNTSPPSMLQFAKTRKLSLESSDLRNRTLLQKRQFFHSHRAQPMELEQVLSDRDSEDEVDDDVADFEDRRMLDDFVDVTDDEKDMMHLWNSFVRKQRVVADGHISWACEAFSNFHGRDLVQAPAVLRCWRLFMIKLWNHGLLDARVMNKCNMILEQCQNQDAEPKRS